MSTKEKMSGQPKLLDHGAFDVAADFPARIMR